MDLLIIKVGHRVLIRTILLQQDRFRKLKWLPSSVAFSGARVIVSGIKNPPIAFITVEPEGKAASSVYRCMQTRLMGEYHGKCPISFV